jgi:hypothetical protein
MISSSVDGKVLDWHWKRRGVDILFYVGDIYIGQLFNLGRRGWSALHKDPNEIGLVEGFKTRYDASHFLLKY